MKRRKFLWYSTVISVSALFPLTGCEKDTELDDFISLPTTLSNIYNKETIISVGKAYLKMFPDEKNKNELETQLMKAFNVKRSVNQLNIKQFLEIIDDQIKVDFEENNIVIVDGWVLSKTEVRQCAYFSILN